MIEGNRGWSVEWSRYFKLFILRCCCCCFFFFFCHCMQIGAQLRSAQKVSRNDCTQNACALLHIREFSEWLLVVTCFSFFRFIFRIYTVLFVYLKYFNFWQHRLYIYNLHFSESLLHNVKIHSLLFHFHFYLYLFKWLWVNLFP